MLKNYKELNIWQKAYTLCLHKLRTEVGDVERMLKALIKSLENKPLDPFSQLIGRRTLK